MDKLLDSIYYDQKNSGSYSGVNNLYKAAHEINPDIKRDHVKQYLSKQLAYTLHFPRREKFKRNRIIVASINEQWEADLVDMQTFSRQNGGYKYILTVIDCFSKMAYVRPVKAKTGKLITEAFKDIFKTAKPLNLRTDRGLEFENKDLKQYLRKLQINHFTSKDEKIKCAIVERFNRTLKSRMFKYFTAKGTRKYINVLQDFVKAYNDSYHRSIRMRPNDVNFDNEKQVFANLFGDKSYYQLRKPHSGTKLTPGDKVRIPYEIKPFDKGYYPTFQDHVFTIEKLIKGNKYMFKIKDYAGNTINQVFYPEQLQKITENLHRIEKVIRRRKRRGVREALVKWMNYPSTYNSWVLEKDIRGLGGML